MNYSKLQYEKFVSEPGVVYAPYVMNVTNPCSEISLPTRVSSMQRYSISSHLVGTHSKMINIGAICQLGNQP